MLAIWKSPPETPRPWKIGSMAALSREKATPLRPVDPPDAYHLPCVTNTWNASRQSITPQYRIAPHHHMRHQPHHVATSYVIARATATYVALATTLNPDPAPVTT